MAPSSAQVPAALASAKYVFVWEDASIQPLSQLYRGPYKVLSCQDKFFSLEIGSRTDTISIDCLNSLLNMVSLLEPVLGPGLLFLVPLLLQSCPEN